MNNTGVTGLTSKKKDFEHARVSRNSAYFDIRDIPRTYYILGKWFPLRGERAHCFKLFCMYDKRFEISKTN